MGLHASYVILYGLTVQVVIKLHATVVFHLKYLMDLLAMFVKRGFQTVLHVTQLVV